MVNYGSVPAEKWVALALMYGKPNNPDANRWETTQTFALWREAVRVVFPEINESEMPMADSLRLYSYYRDWYWTTYNLK
jgi:hypothetical protein